MPVRSKHEVANINKEDFARRLLAKLLDVGMTQKQLAEASGLSYDAIASYTRARSIPTPKSLGQIAQALDCPPADLLAMQDGSPSTRISLQVEASNPSKARLILNCVLPLDVATRILGMVQEWDVQGSAREQERR